MAKKVTLDGLADAVKDVLDEYAQEVTLTTQGIVSTVTKQGVKALQSESAATFGTAKNRKKKYAKTWTSSVETGRLSAQGTIFNTQPGLPHLLENGHVSRNGTGRTFGTVPGRQHIKPVEDEVYRLINQEIQRRL